MDRLDFRPLPNGDLHDRVTQLEYYLQLAAARLSTIELPTLPESLPYLPTAGGTMTGGLSFGQRSANTDDVSKHIELYAGANAMGMGVEATTGGHFNYVVKHADHDHNFRVAGSTRLRVSGSGANVTGVLALSDPPTADNHAATKAYVDGAIAAIPTPIPPEPVVPVAASTIGDVKHGLQTADHDGWVKLDGRLISTLTPAQQGNATTLGLVDNLPDATGAVLMQASALLGDVDGSMTRSVVLTQGNLPNVALTAASGGAHTHPVEITGLTTSPAGAHNHIMQSNVNDQGIQNFNEMLAGHGGDDPGSVYPAIKWRGTATIANDANNGTIINGYAMDGAQDHVHPVSNSGGTISSSGDHTHSVPLGGTAAPITIDITPRALTTNVFCFLGEA